MKPEFEDALVKLRTKVAEVESALPRRALSRRDFGRIALMAASALAGACGPAPVVGGDAGDAGLAGEGGVSEDAGLAAEGGTEGDGGAMIAGLPTLGGAPDTADGRAIAAFSDTVLPGRFRDPTGAPGALDAMVPGLFYDPTLPAARLAPLLRVVLDGLAREMAGRVFERCTFEQRDAILDVGTTRVPELEFAIQLVKLGFYSSSIAAAHLRYPGANTGYLRDADFSFGAAPLATEITRDGNLP